MNEELMKISISLIDGMGPMTLRKLVDEVGNLEGVFNEKKSNLKQIKNVRATVINEIGSKKTLLEAEEELRFLEMNYGHFYYMFDADYPFRLRGCKDAPIIIYGKGKLAFNRPRMLGVVGTRSATEYGKEACDRLIDGLKDLDVTIVSGLAYGIDIHAHKSALKNNLPTIGCLAHSIDRVYPSFHKKTADSMLEMGGLLTEFRSGTKPDRENFPTRNRIIGGLIDGLVVIESAGKGGSMITAKIASSYNRDVFAVAGRINDEYSKGCHKLIKNLEASMVTSASDIMKSMNWKIDEQRNTQVEMFPEVTDDESKICGILRKENNPGIEVILSASKFSHGRLAGVLLALEMKGLIQSLPGKRYKIV